MRTCDLHTHSRFFHRGPEVAPWVDPPGVRLSLRVARRRGIDGVAVTNHDFVRPETLVHDGCIPGIEISTTRGHLLVIGPSPPERTEPGQLTPRAAVDLAREHDCASVVAHPLRNSMLLASDASFDAVEVNGKHPEHRRPRPSPPNTTSPSSAGATPTSRSRSVAPRPASTSTD